MSYFTNIPEVISSQMFSGAGSEPMLRASAAWTTLAAELSSAADSFSSLISDLGSSWQSQAAIAMTGVAKVYGDWLGTAATQATGAATGAESVAAIYEAARAAVVHPAAIAQNRDRLVSLALTNIFGLNAPAIAATDGEYEEMWATDIAAMVGYHSGADAVAQQLAPWQEALTGLCGAVAPTTGGGATALPPAPAATAVEYGLIAGLISTRLGSGLRITASLDTPLATVLGRLTEAATRLTTGPAVITQAAAQLSTVARNPALLTQAASQLSAVAVNPALLTRAAEQLSAVAAAPTVLAAVTADPAVLTQAASRLSAVAANPAALVPISDPSVLTQAAAQLSAVAANPVLLTQAASQLSAVAANPVLLTQAAAQLSAVAANPAVIARIADPTLLTQAAGQLSAVAANPILLTQAASQLSAVAANPVLLTQAAEDLSAIAANPALLTQAAGDLSAIAVRPGPLTRAIDQLGATIATTPLTTTNAAAQLGATIATTSDTAAVTLART